MSLLSPETSIQVALFPLTAKDSQQKSTNITNASGNFQPIWEDRIFKIENMYIKVLSTPVKSNPEVGITATVRKGRRKEYDLEIIVT